METSKGKSIAILGGSFNPMHNGHAAMLSAARKTLSPDELWLMPAKKPPHKPSYAYAEDADRVAMLAAFASDYPDVKVCTEELAMEGFTYTSVTMTKLAEKYPDYRFYFIIGGDSVENFGKWYHPEVIVKHCSLAICTRNSIDRTAIEKITRELKESIGGEYYILDFEPFDVSSSDLREKLLEGADVSDLIPQKILEYIKEKSLYGNTTASSESPKSEKCPEPDDKEKEKLLSSYMESMKKSLKPSRYEHSLGVMKTAAKLAEIYGADVYKAKVAGILHDCAKYLKDDELVNLCMQNNISLSESEVAGHETINALVHSKAGMILARNIYNIQDKEILDSIFYHTVGRPGMSLLEKIIFTADFIEPGRTQPCNPPLPELRKIAEEDIDYAVFLICRCTVEYLKTKGGAIDTATMKTLEYYRQKYEEKNANQHQ